MLLFWHIYVKFGFMFLADHYFWIFMHCLSRVLENIANSDKDRYENNSNNRFECRQGKRSRSCSVKEETAVSAIQSMYQTFYGILVDKINWTRTVFQSTVVLMVFTRK